MKVIISVDPGKQGGIVVMNGDQIITSATPTTGTGAKAEIDINAIVEIFFQCTAEHGYENVIVVTEAVHSIFGVGAKSNFQFGRALGIIEGIIAALQLPYMKVQPKTWQACVFEGVEKYYKKEPSEKGRGSLDTKLMAEIAAKRLYPTLDLRKSARAEKSHNGIVDALCIAHYIKVSNKHGI